MSNVEIAKIGMFASASGDANDARIPVASNGRLPFTLMQHHPRSHRPVSGATEPGQTIDSSSAVRTIATNAVERRDGGTGASGSRRQTA